MTEQEKIKFRNVSRETHLRMCCDQNNKTCSNPLAHSPMEGIHGNFDIKKCRESIEEEIVPVVKRNLIFEIDGEEVTFSIRESKKNYSTNTNYLKEYYEMILYLDPVGLLEKLHSENET